MQYIVCVGEYSQVSQTQLQPHPLVYKEVCSRGFPIVEPRGLGLLLESQSIIN